MTYNEIIQEVSENTGLSINIIDKAYKAFWKYIRESIKNLPLKEDLKDEEFLKLRTNFNIPSLGKLVCTHQRYLKVKDNFNHIKELRKRNEEVD